MFRIPEPNKFCFCMDLRIGSFVIGIFSLIGSLINICTWFSGIRAFQLSNLLSKLYDVCEESCHDFISMFILGITIVVLILDILHLIMSSFLLHGIRKERPKLFIPFLSWQVTRLIISLGLFITLVVVFHEKVILIASYLMVLGCTLALEIYFFLVINSYRMLLCRAQGLAPMELQ